MFSKNLHLSSRFNTYKTLNKEWRLCPKLEKTSTVQHRQTKKGGRETWVATVQYVYTYTTCARICMYVWLSLIVKCGIYTYIGSTHKEDGSNLLDNHIY